MPVDHTIYVCWACHFEQSPGSLDVNVQLGFGDARERCAIGELSTVSGRSGSHAGEGSEFGSVTTTFAVARDVLSVVMVFRASTQ